MKSKLPAIAALAFLLFAPAHAEWSSDQQEIIAQMTALSASTRNGGGGAEAYGAILAPGFTRWTIGSNLINDRAAWIDGVRQWVDDGGFVVEGENTVLDITIIGETAAVRRVVRERLHNPDGSEATYQTGVVETWTKPAGTSAWLLLRASVKPELAVTD